MNASWVARFVAGLVVVAFLACLLIFPGGPGAAEVRQLVEAGTVALENGNFDDAESSAARALEIDPESVDALLLAGRAARRAERYDAALRYLDRVPVDTGDPAVRSAWIAGEILFQDLRRPTVAEERYRRALALDPGFTPALRSLSALLGVTARTRDAVPVRLELIRQRDFDPLQLYLLCMGDSVLENVQLLETFRDAAPDDVLTMLGTARELIDRQKFDEARRLLESVLERRPTLIDARVRLGRLLLDLEDDSSFATWSESGRIDHPDLWVVLGDWWRERGRRDAATRCYWEAARRAPEHERAVYRLARSLIADGRIEAAQPFLERSRILERYFTTVKIAWQNGDPDSVRRACELADSAGLVWEAFGWAHLARQRIPGADWAADAVARLESRLPATARTRSASVAGLVGDLDLSHVSLPDVRSVISESSRDGRQDDVTSGRLSFRDDAAAAGLRFTFFNGAASDEQTRRMTEFNGGGAGILDFDRDGWPDAYLTQGADGGAADAATVHLDRLFRNAGGDAFEDVTRESRLVEDGFSGGVAVGDFDADGFPDLFVANTGANRLFHNNGDGTFSEVTFEAGVAGRSWSTSAALADLNGDALPDLYVVNYLTGRDVFERVCPDAGGVVRSCSPREFEAATDRVLLNDGEGRFVDVTESCGVAVPDGKGLGLVVGDLDGAGGPDVFVANDAVPNFLMSNDGEAAFTEIALPAGLATNGDGRPEACMGVAVGDANGDGLADVFVTNFHNETNTLYRRDSAGLFTDATESAGLGAPSVKLLGFGTQFLDANLDGRPDLIVANGHVDDLRDTGREYAMRPQFFRNVTKGRFTEEPSSTLGPYFANEHLGRGLALVDWNRDGREDAVVSQLHEPAALLTNTTAEVGHFLAIRLVGVVSDRDAVGTVVEVDAGRRTWTRSLFAGDGFQASNERQLVFGLGTAEEVDRVTIHWPSGRVQVHENVTVDRFWIAVEAAPELIVPALD